MARILIGNIKGPQGAQGIQGPQGPVGATGPQGPMPDLINNALATQAGVAALDAVMGKVLQDQITQLNSDLIYLVRWMPSFLESGSIMSWIEAQSIPTSISVASEVTDMPLENFYWIVKVDIGSYGNWKIATAIAINSNGEYGAEYNIAYVNGVWGEWKSRES